MTAQIRGLAMAVKNSNDSMSLAQTAEGAMEEVTNMLQRIRELAVQSANGTMNSSDRASLDAEVQALKAEIDRVANTTQFNSQNLLDGSHKATFQIGDQGWQLALSRLATVQTKDLAWVLGTLYMSRIPCWPLALATAAQYMLATSRSMARMLAANCTQCRHGSGAFRLINNNVDNVEASALCYVVVQKTRVMVLLQKW